MTTVEPIVSVRLLTDGTVGHVISTDETGRITVQTATGACAIWHRDDIETVVE